MFGRSKFLIILGVQKASAGPSAPNPNANFTIDKPLAELSDMGDDMDKLSDDLDEKLGKVLGEDYDSDERMSYVAYRESHT